MYSTFQLAKKYIKYYFAASNGKGHGVHSPFVFDCIKFVLNDKKQYNCYTKIEDIRSRLLQSKEVIEVEDFGAGSAVIKSNKRIVGKIAASSLKPKKFAQLLYRMVAHYKPETIVELGTSFATTTAYLASGNASAKVYTLEGASEIARIAKHSLLQAGVENVSILQGDFAITLPQLFTQVHQIDFAFIDGNHRKQPTVDYFAKLSKLGHSNSIFIFDDIHWSEEMEAAWEEIKLNDAVTLTIDLFFIGIVFFRKDFKVKQHFSIRF